MAGRQIMNRRRQGGFTYIVLLMLIAVMSAASLASVQLISVAIRRDKERELLFVGNQFRNAIRLYYRNGKGGAMRYPSSLEDLLKDPRFPDTRRYLRRIYLDPISNSSQWGLLKGPSGEILGVYSMSSEEPLKKSNFSLIDHLFEGSKHYSDWVFAIEGVSGAPAVPSVQGNTPAQIIQNLPAMRGQPGLNPVLPVPSFH